MKRLLVILACLATTYLFADFECAIRLEISNEYVDEGELLREGWEKNASPDADYTFQYQKTFAVSQLPWKISLEASNFSFGIDAAGEASLLYYFSDYDADACAWTTLPRVSGVFVRPDQPMELRVKGGEYAGGTYSVAGKMTIKVVE